MIDEKRVRRIMENVIVQIHIISLVLIMLLFNCFRVFAQQMSIIAILPFKYVGVGDDYKKLVEGIPDMLMTDLGKSEKITLVERVQIDKALKNFSVESSDIIDPKTVVEIGHWLGARAIVLGSVSQIGSKVRIDCRIIDIRTGRLLKSAKVEGNVKQLFELIDRLSARILTAVTGEYYKNLRIRRYC